MEKFIPYQKMSKRDKQKINTARRKTWGSFNPVTRKSSNPKAYNRSRVKRTSDM